MSQDAFIHEAADANINTPQGENLTVYRKAGVARNAPDPTVPFQVKHSDGVLEPIVGAGGAAFNYSVAVVSVAGPGNTSMELTATPSVGVVGDYSYAWSLHSSNIAGTTVNPVLGAPVANVVSVTNSASSEAAGMVKVVSTHTATGTIAENYFWLTLELTPP